MQSRPSRGSPASAAMWRRGEARRVGKGSSAFPQFRRGRHISRAYVVPFSSLILFLAAGADLRSSAFANIDSYPVAQLVGTDDDHAIVDREALAHEDALAVDRAKLHRTHGHGIVGIHEIDEGARSATLDGARWHHDSIVDRINQQPDIDKLIREESLIRIGELRAQLYGAGRLVDLIVERRQHAR